jgi:asparagine synthase (glutamine-hydrolysing)
MKAAVLNPMLLDTGIFNAGFLKQMVDEHLAATKDHSTALWAVLMFEAFLRKNGADSATRFTPAAASPLIATAA